MTTFTDSTEQRVASITRLLQIITFALVSGLVTFLMFALVKHQFQFQWVPFNQAPLTLVALALFCSATAMAFVLPPLIVKTMLKATVTGRLNLEPASALPGADRVLEALLRVCLSVRIFRLALLEAPGWLAGVSYFLTQDMIGLSLACCSVLFVASQFPTQIGIQNWLDTRADELALLVEEQQQ